MATLNSPKCLLICGIVFLWFCESVLADVCPEPKRDLRMGQQNVDGQTTSFYNNSQSFQVEIYSGFAPQSKSSHSTYCVRYEIENKSGGTIQKLSWPLAGIQIDQFIPKKRESVVGTILSDRPPSLEETWLYAFLSKAKKSYAYQKHSMNSKEFELDINKPSRLITLVTSAPQSIRIAQVNAPIQRSQLKEPTKLPEIGSHYSNGTAEVEATTTAAWDGKTYTISFLIDRVDEKYVKSVSAPYAHALPKVKSSAEILGAIREFQNSVLPLSGGAYKAMVFLPTEYSPPALYVIYQPITVTSGDGRVCFLAAAYSPMPIPSELLSCKLF